MLDHDSKGDLLTEPERRRGGAPVKDVVAAFAKEIGTDVEIIGYECFTLGEGLEKKVENFADEVAAVAGQ